MKVVLFAPPIMDDFFWGEPQPIAMDAVRECPPYGVYLLQAVLRRAGFDAIVADLIAAGTARIDQFAPEIDDCGLVGIAATSMSWPTAVKVIEQVRSLRPDVPIVLGGIHPTMFDHYIMNAFPVDFIIRGEGEIAIEALCVALDRGIGFEDVPNLTWRHKDGNICRNPIGPKIAKTQLADFPLPDFSEIPLNVYKSLSIESSRGCAFDCSFCSTSYRQTWRGMPADAFLDRLETLMSYTYRTQHDFIHIIDDEFSMNPKRVLQMIELFRERDLRPELVYDSRATDLLYDGFVSQVAEYTSQFLVGAEAGYDAGLDLIGKGTTTQILEDAARLLYRHNLSERADFSFVLGFPWETKAEVLKTCQFASHLFSTYGVRILLQWYCQIPGSRLWEEDRGNGLVNESMYNSFGFFRDLYLFRSGVKLSPSEIRDISTAVIGLKTISKLKYGERPMVEYGHPEPIALYFPQEIHDGQGGLQNLREVSHGGEKRPMREVLELRPPKQVSMERPLRHIGV